MQAFLQLRDAHSRFVVARWSQFVTVFALLVGGLLIVGAQSAAAQEAFITTWETTTANESITIPTASSVTDYDFAIDWGDGTTEEITGTDPDPSHSYSSAGTYSVEITGTFPRIFLNDPFNDDSNSNKLQSIDQWGSIEWESMQKAFAGAENMVHNATDAPDLTSVTSMAEMFSGAGSFNGDIVGWDVSNVTNMFGMFQNADDFNRDIEGWDVSNVTNMGFMFNVAETFNGDVSGWNVSNVTNMSNMFSNSAFNQDIGGWNVSNVTNMRSMFFETPFNQDISGWDVSNVTNMSDMFTTASVFNQDLSRWNVASVTNMRRMFAGATSFNQDIGGWDVSGVANMAGMFAGADDFDQDLGKWDVSGVTTFETDFAGGFLEGVGLSPSNYDSLLIGWEQLNLTDSLTFDAGQSQYTSTASSARQAIVEDDKWTINDGGLVQEPFITTWKTTAANESITIPTNGDGVSGYDFTIDWGDGTTEQITGSDPDPSHIYSTAGTYAVEITGTFPRIFLDASFSDGDGDEENARKLRSIDQWGSIQWESMEGAFDGAENMTYTATDKPDLSGVISMNRMFANAFSFNGDIGDWETGSVTDMESMFLGARSFNQDIGEWNVSSVTDMRAMFLIASEFNQDIRDWDVSSVTNMSQMFGSARNFNQDIGSWDVSGVQDMSSMFRGAKIFNRDIGEWVVLNVNDMSLMFSEADSFDQDISTWNTSNVIFMSGMFYGADKFNKEIGSWDVSSVIFMGGMFKEAQSFDQDISEWDISNVESFVDGFGNGFLENAELSPANYDSLLIGWEQLNLTDSLAFDAGQSQYTSAAASARQAIISEDNWTIDDGGLAAEPFITTWETTSANESITVPTDTSGSDYDFQIDWGDGTTEQITGIDPDPSHTYAQAGTYAVEITGTFPHVYVDAGRFGNGDTTNAEKLKSIDQWGSIAWESMFSAFSGAENLTYNATDAPDLSGVINLSFMFRDASTFNGDIGGWNVSNVTDMSSLFNGATSFNQDISGWDVSSVTDMRFMFSNAASFDRDISGWDVSSVTDMGFMFSNATSFDRDISGWDVSSVTNMSAMFQSASSFNQDLGAWDVSNVTNMSFMFNIAESFSGNIGEWDVSNVTSMSSMFSNSAFNQDIGGWNVSSVTDMAGMFARASNFNQDLSGWDVSNVTTFEEGVSGGFLEDAELSPSNYDALLRGWEQLDLVDGVTFDAGTSQYTSEAANARQAIIADDDWTIHDGGAALPSALSTRAPGAPYSPGSPAEIEITVPSGFDPTTGTLYSREAGRPEFRQTSLSVSDLPSTTDTTVSGEVPAEAVTERGVQYYVRMSKVVGEDTLSVTGPPQVPAQFGFVQTRVDEASAAGPFRSETYRMISVPLDVPDRAVRDVLVEQYGDYDPSEWRLFQWSPADSSYREDDEIQSSLVPGQAAWLITDDGDSLTVQDARSAPSGTPVTVTLQPGWNQIASPFPFPVAWSDVEGTEAVSEIARYDGTEPEGERYQFDVSALRPWRGYFVLNSTGSEASLVVPPQGTPRDASASKKKLTSNGNGSQQRYRLRAVARASQRNSTLVDRQAQMGFRSDAGAGLGPEDTRKPPSVGRHIRVAIMSSDGPALARSWKPVSNDGARWDLRVSLRSGAPYATTLPATVHLEESGPRPTGFRRYVLDLDRDKRLPVTDGTVRIEGLGDDTPRHLRVIVGTEAFAKGASGDTPLTFDNTKLRGNAPNPFRRSTTISYQLAEPEDVTIRVYDVLGRRVETLVDRNQRAGVHTVSWQADGMASGVYFCRLEAGEQTSSRRMTIVR